MKTRNIIILALTALLTVSCHTWDAPGEDSGLDSYGNPDLKETNVKTIAEVKAMFKNEISTNDLKKVNDALQIKVVVVGNDEGGNIYKSLYVQDNTGALALSIDQSGLFGAFSVGQCVLIELKDLYVGGYEKQPQVGTLYFNQNKGVDQVGRMTRYEWQRHYKLLNPVEGLSAKPIVTDKMSKLSLERDCGRLVTLVGVRMKDADGVKVFAPSDGSVTLLGGCANRDITGMSDVVVRTSTYAKFANMPMPTEKLTITGVASRYRDGWQLMPRKLDDIQAYTGSEVLDDIEDGTPKVDPAGEGTAASPYNVSAALARAAALPQIESAKDANSDNSFEAVVKGYVKTIKSIDTSYGNAEYTICDDAEGLTKELTVYRGYSLNGDKFKSANEIKVGDILVVSGTIVNFKGTLEFTQGSKLLSINNESGNSNGGNDTPTPSSGNMTKTVDGTVVTFTNSAVTGSTEVTVDFNEQGWANDTKVTTVTLDNGTTIEFAGGENTSNAPKFYTATKGVRMYAKNIVTVKGSKPIAKVVMNCDEYNGTKYIGNDLAYGNATGNTVVICNEHTAASGGVQMRVKTMTITFGE